MADRRTIYVRAGDTEPLQLKISGNRVVAGVVSAIADLDELTTAKLYLRKRGESTNHVDGATLTKGDAARSLIFDPDGAEISGGLALATAGTYDGYVLATWSNGETTRHPGKNTDGGYPLLHIVAVAEFED